jgi:hypothetical protein
MKKRGLKKRVSVVPDPHYPVKHRTVTITLTLPGADAEAVATFQAATIEFNIPNRIEAARQRLPQIAGLPEHAAASSWLRRAAACLRDAQNPSLPVEERDKAAGGPLPLHGGAFAALDQFDREMRDGLLRRAIGPSLKRDARLQAANRGPRGSRMPELDTWLDNELRANPGAANKALWKALPIDVCARVYRDDDNVFETNRKGAGHPIGSAGFAKRVTAARQRRNAVSK